MYLKRVPITLGEFQRFLELQSRQRWDWPATFSTNSKGEVWPYVRNGNTPPDEREDVRGLSDLLSQIADIYSAQREEGGRFFINEEGAFWKTPEKEGVQFVEWDAEEPLRGGNRYPHAETGRSISLNELTEIMRGKPPA